MPTEFLTDDKDPAGNLLPSEKAPPVASRIGFWPLEIGLGHAVFALDVDLARPGGV